MMGSPNRSSSWLNWAQAPREQGGLGLAPHQAAGIVGNLVHESGQDLNPWGPTGDNGTAWGTAQWRGDRLAKLKARPDYQTTEGQQAFMREELDGSENKAYRALQAAKTPEEAAHAWDALYERSDGSTRDQRMQSARSLMAQFGGDTQPGALTSSYAPTESKKSMPAALSADNTMGQGVLGSDYEPNYANTIGQALTGVGASIAGISNPDQAKVLAAQAAGMQKQAKDGGTWSLHVMPNGQVVRINSKTGVPQTLGNAAKAEADEYTKAYDKGNADDAIAMNKKLSDAAATAMANQSDYAMLGKALKNPDVGQGLDGPVRNFMNKAYVSMGLGDAKTAAAAADGDIINALGPKMVLQILQNGGDKLLPGSMSDNDVKLGMRFGAGEKLEPEANRKLMAAAIKHNERVLEAEQFRQQVADANGGRLPADFRSQLGKLRSKWAEQDAATEAAPAQPASPAQPNTFKTKSGKTLNWSLQ